MASGDGAVHLDDIVNTHFLSENEHDGSQTATDHAMSGTPDTEQPSSIQPQLSDRSPIHHASSESQRDEPNDPTSGPEAMHQDVEERNSVENQTNPEATPSFEPSHLPALASPIRFQSVPPSIFLGCSINDSPINPRSPLANDTKTVEQPERSTSVQPPASLQFALHNEDSATQVDNPNVNNHEDITMVNAESVSQEAQRHELITAEQSSKGGFKDGTSLRLPGSTTLDPVALQQMLAAQQAMIRDAHQKKHAHNSSNAGPSDGAYHQRGLSSLIEDADEHRNASAAMGGADLEDDSWMYEEHSGRDEEYEELQRTRNALERKKKNGKITKAQALELFNVEARIRNADKLKAAAVYTAQEEEQADSLFVAETREQVVERHMRDNPSRNASQASRAAGDNSDDEAFQRMLEGAIHGDGNDGPENSKQKGKPQKKGTGKRPSNAREVRELQEQREKERAKGQSKRGRASKGTGKKPAASGRGRPKGKGKAAANGRGAKKNGKKSASIAKESHGLPHPNGRSGVDEYAKVILDNLINDYPIQDTIENYNAGIEAEPEIVGKQTKASQFKLLFANVPSLAEKATTEEEKKTLEEASKSAIREDKRKLHEASKSFGYAKVKAVSGKWLIAGMKSPLYHHQLLGAQWMVSRELSADPPYGGLLADSMGLGKTVQTLACMVGNPPRSEDIKRNIKATLIVVPAAVLDQWVDEISFHAEQKIFRKILKYKAIAQLSKEVLEDMDIVITTYNEVMKQFPYPDKTERARIDKIGYRRWWQEARQKVGVLYRVHWYRVVLDEAHAIKNNSSRTSLACQSLISIYRWCLTGTPLLNRLEELFPYLRFLKADYSIDWQTFQKYFCDPNSDESQSRIATLLSYTMMRRTMKTTIMNRPIITLPKPHPEILYVHFSPEEQAIYRITENRFRCNINRFLRSDDPTKNYSAFMVQLLRLRQCTSHPYMLERTIKEAWTLEDVDELKKRLKRLGSRLSNSFYEQTKIWVQESEHARIEEATRGQVLAPIMPFGRGDYGQKFDMDKALNTLDEGALHKRVNCGICGDIPDHPKELNCHHLVCKECLETYIHERVAADDDYLTCPSCDEIFTEAKDRELACEPGNDDNSQGRKSRKQNVRPNSKGLDAMGFEPGAESVWLDMSDSDDKVPLTPSSKTTALKAKLLQGFEEAPLDKVVIYVQFRLLARIVGRLCNDEGWGFLYLSGDCYLDHRTKATRRFSDDPDIKILVSGLKCGGLGLNFPWANRCISLDLWWNNAVEQQAFGRIFRIGQCKETHMTRIVVRNSVDVRLLTMQIHKMKDIETAMNQGKTGLTLDQLAGLFGFLVKDEDGEILGVESDYEDEESQVQVEDEVMDSE